MAPSPPVPDGPRRRGDRITARSRFRRRLTALALGKLVLLSVLLVPNALAEATTAQLSVADPLIAYGGNAGIAGSISAGVGCTAGRQVTLEWRAVDASAFDVVDTGITAADGSFAFEPQPPHTGRFRAVLGQEGSCLAATTNEVAVRVRAAVDAAVAAPSLEVGSCASVSASVRPPRPGQVVTLQRRTPDGWVSLEELTLDAGSSTRASACFTWRDLGVVRLRVRWVAQDERNETAASPVLPLEVSPTPWMAAIEDAIGRRHVSVSVGDDEVYLYGSAEDVPRIPASNEKLLLAMAMLDAFGPTFRIRTSAAATAISPEGIVDDLWILGRGDPGVDGRTLGRLARELVEAGLERVRGRVIGGTGYFSRDWDAPGWNAEARDYVNRPTALVFERNERRAPERRAARALTLELEALGVRVRGAPGAGRAPGGAETLAFVSSRPLRFLLGKVLRPSDNFMAETLGKRLGAQVNGVPGTIAKAAAAIQAWVDARGVSFSLHDASGLSYANRVTAEGLVRLLWAAEAATWGDTLRRVLPTGGQGTLEHRLHGSEVRAKTGSLDGVSALSGWVRSERTGAWIGFSILCQGMPKSVASAIEDRIVLILRHEL